MAIKKRYAFPRTIGGMADKLYELSAKKRVAAAVVAEIEDEEKALKALIIDTLPKSKASGIAGKVALVKVGTKEKNVIKNWPDLWNWAKKKNAFDLFQHRLNEAAVDARIEAGEKIDGVEKFTVVTVSCTKVK